MGVETTQEQVAARIIRILDRLDALMADCHKLQAEADTAIAERDALVANLVAFGADGRYHAAITGTNAGGCVPVFVVEIEKTYATRADAVAAVRKAAGLKNPRKPRPPRPGGSTACGPTPSGRPCSTASPP
jgi:hypothetical protein